MAVKRTAEGDDTPVTPLKGGERPEPMDVDHEMGEFEDEFEDEFESEDEIIEAGVDGRPDAEREAEENEDAMNEEPSPFIVGRSKLDQGQILAPDPSTYEMLHNLSSTWPCLSFDIIRDHLGDDRKVYPATMYMVSGTQADHAQAGDNQLMVMKLSGLGKMEKDVEDSDEEDSDDEDADPILESKIIPMTTTMNRIRAFQTKTSGSNTPTTLTAAMTESSHVYIHDVSPHLHSFDNPGSSVSATQNNPVHIIRSHKSEGYGIDWSSIRTEPSLLTGDNNGSIYLTQLADNSRWSTQQQPFTGHEGSVEEIQWSPSEQNVFASASSDGTIRIWDIRSKSHKPAISMQVSNADVNVLSWSRKTTHLLASGDDDGVWGVWDLRQWKKSQKDPKPIASFDYHKEQITSIEWHPTDDSIVAVAAGDNTVTLWDLAVEIDDEESKNTAGVEDIPPQLLFVHYLKDAKEVHWHPQIIGSLVGTGEEFSVFRTISV